ncbi:hypothetical protein KFK09_002718 [Dendrobium nobile]|uniref:Uncharacterized protein n=1 Tax=Dendrobium nobile TaxID=94219 RepID=A0A8T3C748_DENNO|nr:hypothetical protein KFK09_002718 [Dendrobium nobile]
MSAKVNKDKFISICILLIYFAKYMDMIFEARKKKCGIHMLSIKSCTHKIVIYSELPTIPYNQRYLVKSTHGTLSHAVQIMSGHNSYKSNFHSKQYESTKSFLAPL